MAYKEIIPVNVTRGDAEAIQGFLVQAIAAALETDPELVPLTTPLTEMGFDSLMAIVLKNQVELDLHLEISMATLLEGPTVQELSAFIAAKLATALPGLDNAGERQLSPPPSVVAQAAPVEEEISLEALRRGGVGAVQDYLIRTIAEALEIDPQQVPLTTPLTELGFDSLMAVVLKNQVELGLHLEISMARLLEGPTVQELSAGIAEELAATAGELGGPDTTANGIQGQEWEEGEL